MRVIAFERFEQGTSKIRRLRRLGRIPGIVYGSGKPQLVELDHNSFFYSLKKEEFHASILDFEIGELKQQVLLRHVQYHPFKPFILHVDFQRVDQNRMITTKIPLHFINQENNPAVRLSGAVISHIATELEITCFPGILPKFIELDLLNIEAGQSFHARDVILPVGVKLVPHIESENPVLISATIPTPIVSEDNSSSDKDMNS